MLKPFQPRQAGHCHAPLPGGRYAIWGRIGSADLPFPISEQLLTRTKNVNRCRTLLSQAAAQPAAAGRGPLETQLYCGTGNPNSAKIWTQSRAKALVKRRVKYSGHPLTPKGLISDWSTSRGRLSTKNAASNKQTWPSRQILLNKTPNHRSK